ncbi:uncharacterized protein B0H18DRAFT_1042775, partial [Fomitopsis serialis]|uniref:uncharacterized protein n=1 Tax=Fomitopsis serialis TaxID=139415 RepID=UPI00200739B8
MPSSPVVLCMRDERPSSSLALSESTRNTRSGHSQSDPGPAALGSGSHRRECTNQVSKARVMSGFR